MLITCPNCRTAYDVEEAKLGPSGRSVRCAHCRELWVAKPPNVEARPAPFAAAEAEPPAGDPAPEHPGFTWDTPNHEAGDVDPGLFADSAPKGLMEALSGPPAAPARANSPLIEAEPERTAGPRGHAGGFAADEVRRGSVAKPGSRGVARHFGLVIAASILLLAALVAAVIGWRTDIVRLAPQTARLYAALRLPVNLRGLVFENVRLGYETAEGVPVMVIEGTIANRTKRDAEVPRLRFAVRNADRLETYAWTALPAAPRLGAGETLPFRTRLASPPGDAGDVLVRFHHRHDLASGG